MEKKIIKHNQKEIHYTIYGEGLPVMLVHGFGEDDTVWRNPIAALKDDYQLIVPQLPGTGRSALADETRMETLALAVLQIMDAERLDQVVMIGHSMGGYTTLAFAEAHPDRLKGFGLFHSTAFADSEEKKANRRKGMEFIREHGGAEFLRTITPNLFSENTKANHPEIVKEIMDNIPAYTDEALIAYYQAMLHRPDRTDVLRTAKVPVLFIIGKNDQAAPYSDTLPQSTLPDTAYVSILPQAGHLGMWEDTATCNHALKEFLSGIADE